MEQKVAVNKNKVETREIVLSALLIALVYIATSFINIPIAAAGGLIHTGNIILFMSAIVFGRKHGAIAGAFGMALFDIASMWVPWAPFTFVIRFAMGWVVGTIAYKNKKNGTSMIYNIIGILLSGIVLIVGYYITEIILLGNLLAPMKSIPGNIAQLLIGFISLPISSLLIKMNVRSILGGK